MKPKPCPFCGHKEARQYYSSTYRCMQCGARGPEIYPGVDDNEEKEMSALERWNTRAYENTLCKEKPNANEVDVP